MSAVDFGAARRLVARQLDRTYAGWRESPKVLAYGFDTGRSWAPMVDWDGIMGAFVILVEKRTGKLMPLSFPELEALPLPRRVGQWPADEEAE